MSSAHPLFSLKGPNRLRTLALCAAFAAALASAVFLALVPGRAQVRDDTVDVGVLASWALIALGYAWMRFRPRKPYDDSARPRAEAFQGKRARLLILCTAYVALLLTPLAIYEATAPQAHASAIDRLFHAVLFLAPCGLVLGVMTTGIYSRQWGALVDDELTLTHRAAAFRTGFWLFAGLGAAAFGVASFQPTWAAAALPAVIGPSIAAAGLRFALLERAAAKLDG